MVAMRAFIFDLEGTLDDTVYAHVLAWQQALEEAGIVMAGWVRGKLLSKADVTTDAASPDGP